MENRILYGLGVMLMCLVGSCFSQGEVKLLRNEAEWQLILTKSPLPIVVTITSSFCGVPCAILDAQVARLAETYGNLLTFYKADILKNPFFANIYKVAKVPSLIVFKGGEEIERLDEEFGDLNDADDFIQATQVYEKINSLFNIITTTNSTPLLDAMIAYSPSSPPSGGVKLLNNEAEWRLVLTTSPLPIVVTITSSFCGDSCAILDDQVARLAEIYNQLTFYQADILKNPFFARLFKVVRVPTLIVFKDGKEIGRLEYNFSWGEISELIEISTIHFPQSPTDSAQTPSSSAPTPSITPGK